MRWTEYQAYRLHPDTEIKEKGVPWYVGNKIKAYEFARGLGVSVPLVYKSFKNAQDFDSSDLPEYFVVKPLGLHSTQGVMLLKQSNSGIFYDFLRQRTLSKGDIVNEQIEWYQKCPWKGDYRLICEELLVNENGQHGYVPLDYKLYCFHKRVELVTQIDRNTSPPKICWFLKEFELIKELNNFIESDWKLVQPGVPQRPNCWEELVSAAKKVSTALNTPFASVDMFATLRGPVLGEITLAPGGPYHGKMYKFTSPFDSYLGSVWTETIKDTTVYT